MALVIDRVSKQYKNKMVHHGFRLEFIPSVTIDTLLI